MRLKGLIEPLKNSTEFQNIISSIENKKYPIGIYGAS